MPRPERVGATGLDPHTLKRRIESPNAPPSRQGGVDADNAPLNLTGGVAVHSNAPCCKGIGATDVDLLTLKRRFETYNAPPPLQGGVVAANAPPSFAAGVAAELEAPRCEGVDEADCGSPFLKRRTESHDAPPLLQRGVEADNAPPPFKRGVAADLNAPRCKGAGKASVDENRAANPSRQVAHPLKQGASGIAFAGPLDPVVSSEGGSSLIFERTKSTESTGLTVRLPPDDVADTAAATRPRKRLRCKCPCGNWYTISKFSPQGGCHPCRQVRHRPGGGSQQVSSSESICGGAEINTRPLPTEHRGADIYGAPVYLSPTDTPAIFESHPACATLTSQCACGKWYANSKLSSKGECHECQRAPRLRASGVDAIGHAQKRIAGVGAQEGQPNGERGGATLQGAPGLLPPNDLADTPAAIRHRPRMRGDSQNFHGAPVYLSPSDFPESAAHIRARARQRSLCHCGKWYTISKLSPAGGCPECRQKPPLVGRGVDSISTPPLSPGVVECSDAPRSLNGGVAPPGIQGVSSPSSLNAPIR